MQTFGIVILAAIGRALCAAGSHPDEPVAVRRGHTPRVLLRCGRCERTTTLDGLEATRWLERYLAT